MKGLMKINWYLNFREIATVTYRSGPEWNIRFGRKFNDVNEKITLCPSFEIENYLDYQGSSFATKYDPNSLLYLSKVKKEQSLLLHLLVAKDHST